MTWLTIGTILNVDISQYILAEIIMGVIQWQPNSTKKFFSSYVWPDISNIWKGNTDENCVTYSTFVEFLWYKNFTLNYGTHTCMLFSKICIPVYTHKIKTSSCARSIQPGSYSNINPPVVVQLYIQLKSAVFETKKNSDSNAL